MNLRLESHVVDGRVWLQFVNPEGEPQAMALVPLKLWAEFRAAMQIVEGKLIADGLLVPRDLEVQQLPGADAWN